MQIIFVRHGIAEEHSRDGKDESRRLTEQGQKRTAQAARGLATLIDPPDLVYTSPKVRAMQTAQIVASMFELEPRTLLSLAQGSASHVLNDVARLKARSVMLVGHEPTLSMAMAMCLAAPHLDEHAADGTVQLKKAGAGCVFMNFHRDPAMQRGMLLWLATPRMLRQLGSSDADRDERED
jgi:phosphohistidine phosphatase